MSTGLGHLTLPELEDTAAEEYVDDEDFEDEDFELEPDTGIQAEEETESPDDASGENWEDRFKGLQSQYQEAIEGYRNLQGTVQQQQQQQAQMVQNFQQQLFRQQIADLEPEQQRAAMQQFQARVTAQQQAQQLQQREQHLAQAFQFVDQYGKKIAAQEIASRYQVPADKLLAFDSPEEMMEAAKLAKSRRAGRKNQPRNRRRGGQFEGGTSPGRPKQKPKPASISEARDAFAQLQVPGQQR